LTKSKVLTALNRKDERNRAEESARHGQPPADPFFARGLQGEKRNEEAFAIFRENAKKHPDNVRAFRTGWMYCSQANSMTRPKK